MILHNCTVLYELLQVIFILETYNYVIANNLLIDLELAIMNRSQEKQIETTSQQLMLNLLFLTLIHNTDQIHLFKDMLDAN